MDKIRVFEAFAGIRSQSIALRNLGINYEVVAISEIDKYAIQAGEAIQGKANNLGDISKIKVEDIPQHDLFTYSFPCQDISVAGKINGIIKGQTRSGLLYECEKVIEYCRPKYLLLENVKNLVGKKFKPQFDEWLKYLESLGYTNYWQVLNAKDYGVPQNRERVFVVSILGEHEPYEFPKPIPLNKCVADILEAQVDEKYYIDKPFNLVTNGHQISIPQATKKGYIEMDLPGVCDLSYPNSKTRRGRVQENGKVSPTLTASSQDICYIEYNGKMVNLPCIAASRARNPENPSDRSAGMPKEQRLEINTKGTSNTITSIPKDNYAIDTNYRVRKLTPKECFRLMGLNDDDIDKIQQTGISNAQQYKMAGNSIVVNVLEAIFRNLFVKK